MLTTDNLSQKFCLRFKLRSDRGHNCQNQKLPTDDMKGYKMYKNWDKKLSAHFLKFSLSPCMNSTLNLSKAMYSKNPYIGTLNFEGQDSLDS